MISGPIIFIVPVRAGKSTLSKLLARQLELEYIALDEIRWSFYREISFDDKLARQIRVANGFLY